MPYSVLIVEDDPRTRRHFEIALKNHSALSIWDSVGTYADAVQSLKNGEPHVLFTDLGLPDGNGLELIKSLPVLGYSTVAMVITVFDDEKHVIPAIEAGAMGYLLKDIPQSEIGDAILEMLDGGSPISPSIARYLIKRFQFHKNDGPQLSNKEEEILKLIVKGFSFKHIARLLSISPHTVGTHVKHIYKKLSVSSRSEAVYEAIQLGIVKPN